MHPDVVALSNCRNERSHSPRFRKLINYETTTPILVKQSIKSGTTIRDNWRAQLFLRRIYIGGGNIGTQYEELNMAVEE